MSKEFLRLMQKFLMHAVLGSNIDSEKIQILTRQSHKE